MKKEFCLSPYYNIFSQIEPSLIIDFINESEDDLKLIYSSLKDLSEKYLENLNYIARLIHNIKGNAALLDLNFFSEKAHQVENAIIDLKKKTNLKQNDILSLNRHINEIQEMINAIESYIQQKSKISQKISFENKNIIILRKINEIIQKFCHKHKKEVDFIYDNFDPQLVPLKYLDVFKDILIQLVQNSLVHGIETPKERVSAGKKSLGTILLSHIPNEKEFEFSIKDDGRGLQILQLKEKAVTLSLADENIINKWDDSRLLELIFLPGVTTSKKISLNSGRGIGMNVIKEKIEKYSGKILVLSKENEFCEFRISLPQ